MRPPVREALDRLSFEVQSEQVIRDLLLVQAELMSHEELMKDARKLFEEATRELKDARALLGEVIV